MQEKIFDLRQTNINNAALIVPQEEGGSEDDTGVASIGDATMRHVHSLNPSERQMWESLLTMRSGAIFRVEPSPAWNDPDPFSLSGQDLENYFEKLKKTAKGGLTEANIAPIREAFEQEAERRAKSEDMFDHADVVPYDTLQDNPGMLQKTDVPAAPADKLAYMGETSQMFMDFIPEGHPHIGFINQVLQMLNRDIDEFDEDFAKWFRKFLVTNAPTAEINKAFTWLIDELTGGKMSPVEATQKALTHIDIMWSREYRERAHKALENDKVRSLIMKNKKEWAKAADQGVNVYPEIKRFGQLLFSQFRDKMKSHHWNEYHKIKKIYAARVVVRGIDINRCDRSQLTWIFGEKARDVWSMRPFSSLQEVKNKGLLTASVFADDGITEGVLQEMEQKFIEAKQTMSLSGINTYRERLLMAQKDKELGITKWNPIWNYYAILRQDLMTAMEEHRKATKEVTNG